MKRPNSVVVRSKFFGESLTKNVCSFVLNEFPLPNKLSQLLLKIKPTALYLKILLRSVTASVYLVSSYRRC